MNHPAKPEFGRFGVWVRDAVSPGEAVEIEKLGYDAIWVGGSPAAELSFVEPILAQTTSLQVATGVITMWTEAPEAVAESFHRIDNSYPGRFLLGIGVGHPRRSPSTAIRSRRLMLTSTSWMNTVSLTAAALSLRWGHEY